VSTGYTIDIEALRARYPEVGWQRFGGWAREAVPPML
jgi:hypothetical protein